MTISTKTLAGKKPAQSTVNAKSWTVESVADLYELPFNDLLHRAQGVHREHFASGEIELATLLSIKTGGCPEDCAYCPQAARYHTGVKAEKLLPLKEVIAAATAAKQNGATRFCMGAAWREPKARDIEKVQAMVGAVKALGLETCATLGMLSDLQARQLKQSGLDAVALNPGPTLTYLSGVRFHLMERPVVLIVARDGDPVLVLPELETPKL